MPRTLCEPSAIAASNSFFAAWYLDELSSFWAWVGKEDWGILQGVARPLSGYKNAGLLDNSDFHASFGFTAGPLGSPSLRYHDASQRTERTGALERGGQPSPESRPSERPPSWPVLLQLGNGGAARGPDRPV